MSDYIIPLSSREAFNPDLTGSKAAALSKMVAQKVVVPDAFVVTTSFFKAVVESLSEPLEQLGRSTSTSDNALNHASHDIRQSLLDIELPRGAVSGIRNAWKAMGSPGVSVRSSSTAEDLADASFAGQYDSFLNVTSFNEIIQKIRMVWASLHSPHAIGYRRRNGLSHADALMAVIVQTQLTPDASGVMFTRDPISRKRQSVVTAALGLGEGVVAGTAQTDQFILSPRTRKVISSEVTEKKVRVDVGRSGGIRTVPVPRKLQGKPALLSKHLTQLAGTGQKLAKLFGSPQDIEFATQVGKLYILQSRPMTAIEPDLKPDEPWTKRINRKHTWARRGGPFYRLEQDAAVSRLRHSKDCYDETGSSMTLNHVGIVTNGYMYVRPNEAGERALKKRHALQTRRVNRSERKGLSYFEDVLQAIIEDRHARLKKKRASIKALPDQVDYMAACVDTMGYVQGNLHWRQGKPGGRPDWHEQFSELTGRPKHEANVFLQAIPNRMTMLISRIVELAQIAQSDPVVKQLFLDRNFDAFSSPEISKRARMKTFKTRFNAMMRVYGQRSAHGYGTGAGFATPTWNIDHTLPYEFIATYVEQDLVSLLRGEKRALRERERATEQVRRKLANAPKKLEAFNKALAQAIMWVRFLEDHNYYMEQLSIGTMREAIHATGQQLVKRGQIDHPDDVFHFSITELRQIAKKKTAADLRDRVLARTEERERRRRMRPPATLGKKPKKTKAKPGDQPPAGLDGEIIRGASASSGRVTGKAIVALPNKEHPRIHPGDILVAPNVGPDWTPVFATIGGLVLDSGSLGQHAALVAREYRIPSVMQTKEASRLIKDGQIITVDGDAGTIELIQ